MAPPRKRARIATNDNFIFPDEVLLKIIQAVPLAQWPKLVLVSKRFQRCVKTTYRTLTSLNLNDLFLPEFGKHSKKLGKLKQCLTNFVGCCPRLQTISGFDCVSDNISPSNFELLQKLTELKNISFDNCRLNIDYLSRFLKTFPRVKCLAFRNCEFWRNSFKFVSDDDRIMKTDECFGFFEKFSDLQVLTINGIVWSLSGNFLSVVNAHNLKVLNFSESKFCGPIVVELLNRCVNLETLSLYDPLTGSGMYEGVIGLQLNVLECLPNLPKLREFHLHIDELYGYLGYTADNLLNVLVRCITLRDFHLRSHRFIVTDNFLRGLITGCPLLETLNLDAVCDASKQAVVKIADLRCLTSLSLLICEYNCDVLKALFSELHKLTHLSRLTICAPQLQDPGLLSVKMPDSLTSFTYTGDRLTKWAVKRWVESGFLKKLKVLKLFSNVTNLMIKSISTNMPILESFYVRGKMKDETLLLIAENCKRLEMLDLKMCTEISENGLLNFLSKCGGLKCLFVHSSFTSSVPNNKLFQPYKKIIRLE